MKTIVLSVMALGAMLFMGCSVDPIEDSADLQVNESTTTYRAVTRPFKVRGSGTFEVVAPNSCPGLTQIHIQGSGNATHLGLFTADITYCTDFAAIHQLSGKQIAANGDEVYFYSVGFGVDEQGQFTDYIYEGGTGRFLNATGELRLYGVSEFTTPTTGVYSNHGTGTLTF